MTYIQNTQPIRVRDEIPNLPIKQIQELNYLILDRFKMHQKKYVQI